MTSVTTSYLMLLADKFVEFCNPRHNDKSAAGPPNIHYIHLGKSLSNFVVEGRGRNLSLTSGQQ